MKRGNNVTSQPEMPSSSNASRHRNQKVSRNSRRRKNRKEISGDGEEGRSRMTIEDEKDVKVVLDEKEAEGQGDTQFLEVDLGKDYFVQQIVLEVCSRLKIIRFLMIFYHLLVAMEGNAHRLLAFHLSVRLILITMSKFLFYFLN